MVEDRRAQILRIATRLFSEKGYARTTLDDVAAEIGFTKPAIYHWFDSKDQILFEIHRDIVEPALEEVRQIRATGGSPTEQLRRILTAHVERVLLNVDANTVFARESAQLTTDRGEEIRSLDGAYEHEVRAVYAAGVAAGEFADIDPVVAIGTLLSAYSWVSQWYRSDGPLTGEAISGMIGTLLESGYRGDGA
ncbi:MAG: TetR/AcrR family transcriptional regulator [bacterium]|nr:TetR/AcrR family transcriptional regulator [bacterium]